MFTNILFKRNEREYQKKVHVKSQFKVRTKISTGYVNQFQHTKSKKIHVNEFLYFLCHM